MYPTIPHDVVASAVQLLSYGCTVVLALLSFMITTRP